MNLYDTDMPDCSCGAGNTAYYFCHAEVCAIRLYVTDKYKELFEKNVFTDLQ